MQKIKNPILCWIVILAVFIRPTPAQAVLPALGLALLEEAAIGAAIATGAEFASAAYDYYKAGGVPVQDYYAPTAGMKYADSYNASGSTASVDSTKKTITRPVQAIKTFPPSAPGGKSYHFGKQTAVGVGVAALASYLLDHPSTAPGLADAIAGSTFTPYSSLAPLPAGSVLEIRYETSVTSNPIQILLSPAIKMVLTGPFGSPSYSYCSSVANPPLPVLTHVANANVVSLYGPGTRTDCTPPSVPLSIASAPATVTTGPLTPLPSSVDYQRLADAVAGLSGAVGELDATISANKSPGLLDVPKLSQPEIDQAAVKTAELQAQDRADQLKAEAEADPTNTAKQIAAEEAQAEAERRKLDYERNYDQLEDQDPQEPEPEMIPPPPGPEPDIDLEIDLTPFLTLQDKAMGKFPFSMVSSLGSLFSGLTSAPVTPSMDVPMPWGMAPKQITLSHWDDFAGKWRMMIALFFHASCIYAIIRRYS